MASEQYGERITRVRVLMRTNGLDFLVVGPSADLTYLTGAELRPSERLAVLILPREGPSTIVLPGFEASSLPPLPPGVSVRTWGESDNPAHITAGIIADSMHTKPGGANVTIGVGERLWAVYLLRLQSELPRAAFTPATAVLSQARLIKSAAEVELLKQAGSRADSAFMEMVKRPFIGRKEIDVSREFAKLMETRGLSVTDLPIVGSGPNSASPHHHASERVIEAGEPVVLDFWGTYKGYYADCTRTVWAGSEPAAGSEQAHVYGVVALAQESAVQAGRPGISCEALDNVARSVIVEAGYGEYFSHRLGHGIGLDAHEAPFIVQGNDMVLQDQMAFSVEPGVYISGKFGVRIEDIVALVDGHAVRMNNTEHGVIVVS
ncbi:MAG: Xaa-Pro peptidase family protein [Chloroflexota bacterium]